MATPINEVRAKTNRVKTHILDRYLKLADRVDEKGISDLSESEGLKYWELTSIFAKTVLPRTQEITGEEGGAIVLKFDKTFINAPNSTSQTAGDSQEQSAV